MSGGNAEDQPHASKHGSFNYDVVLSFAGEDRDYVDRVAEHLKHHDVKVFYDRYEQISLWGKDLYQHLDDVYRNQAHYCVIFVSNHYAEKLWTSHEAQSAQARAFEEHSEYILPARFDDTDIPGLRPTIGYINLRGLPAEQFADMIVDKIGHSRLREYLPSNLRFVYGAERIGATTKQQKKAIDRLARTLFGKLKVTSPEERHVLWHAFTEACEAELPVLHVNLGWLCRSLDLSRDHALEVLAGLRPIGLRARVRKFNTADHPEELGADEDDLVLEFGIVSEVSEIATVVAKRMMLAGPLCDEHSWQAFEALDLSYLVARPNRQRCAWGREIT